MLTWNELMCLPSLKDALRVKENAKNQLLVAMQYIWAPGPLSATERIYVFPEDLLPELEILEGISAVVLTKHRSKKISPNCFANLAVLPDTSGEAFQRELTASFERGARIKVEEAVLLKMLRNNDGLDAMASELSRWIGRPLAILDTNFSFLTHIEPEWIGEYVSSDFHDLSGISQTGLKELLDEDLVQASINAIDPFFYMYKDGAYSIYNIALRNNGITIGILGIPGSATTDTLYLPVEYVHELPMLADLFSSELAKSELYSNNGQSSLSYIFSMIMEKEPDNWEEIQARCRLYGYHLLPDMYLLYVPIDKKDTSPSFLASTLQNIFPNSIYLIRNEDILFLISRAEGHDPTPFEIEIWDSQLKRLGLHAGITSKFHTFDQIRSLHLRTAKLALIAGMSTHPEDGLYRFEDHQLDALLADVGSEDLQMFCYPPLLRLIDYDRKKDAQLVETLRAYLEEIRSPQKVCEKLFIHRNTLYKRIAKIEEIMGCSISDPEVIMKIQLTFHILSRENDS